MKKAELKSIWKKEENVAHIHGWDFSHIHGRYEEEMDLPWDYAKIVKQYLNDDMNILDYDTGGGEFLLSLEHPFHRTAATEGYQPNVELCKEILLPFGIDFEANRDAFSYETEEYGIGYIEVYLQTIEDLDYLGFDIEDGITYTYRDSEGKLFEETYYAEDFVTNEEYWEYNDPENLRNTKSNDAYEFVKYEIMEPENLAVLTLYSCEYNEEYKECLADMFREVKEKGIDNVCVDLRDNGGGNSLVADEFIHYLNVDSYRTWGQDWRLGVFMISSKGGTLSNQQYTDLLFDGDVYVLTSTNSFSSAMDFAMLISDNKIGMIVGEPSGNKPRSYGDISVFKLKNSGLLMQVSTKKWYRVDETITDELIEPDIECKSEDALQVLVEYLEGQ